MEDEVLVLLTKLGNMCYIGLNQNASHCFPTRQKNVNSSPCIICKSLPYGRDISVSCLKVEIHFGAWLDVFCEGSECFQIFTSHSRVEREIV